MSCPPYESKDHTYLAEVPKKLTLLRSKMLPQPPVNSMDRLESICNSMRRDFTERMNAITSAEGVDFAARTREARQVDLVITLVEIIGGLHNRIAQLEEDKVAAAS